MKTFLCILILISLGAPSLWARTVTVSLESAGDLAARSNPGLAAARQRIAEAEGRLRNAGRLDNPEVGAGYRQNVRTPERAGDISFTQRFPLTGRLRLERAVSQAELAAARAEVRDAERKIGALARAAAVRLLAIEAQQALWTTQLANAREIAELTRKQLEAAQASVADATLAELQAEQIEAERIGLDVQRATAAGELKPLLGLGENDSVRVTGALATPAEATARTVSVNQRPDILAARETATAARSAAELERARKWADLGVTLSAESQLMEDAPDGLQRDEFLGLRFSLPLPLWNDNSGRVQEAAAAARRRELEVAALRVTATNEAATARGEMAALARVVQNLGTGVIPKAVRVEELLRTAQAAGQMPLIEVLRARDRRFQVERQRVDALREYHLARVRYEAAVARGSKNSPGK